MLDVEQEAQECLYVNVIAEIKKLSNLHSGTMGVLRVADVVRARQSLNIQKNWIDLGE